MREARQRALLSLIEGFDWQSRSSDCNKPYRFKINQSLCQRLKPMNAFQINRSRKDQAPGEESVPKAGTTQWHERHLLQNLMQTQMKFEKSRGENPKNMKSQRANAH